MSKIGSEPNLDVLGGNLGPMTSEPVNRTAQSSSSPETVTPHYELPARKDLPNKAKKRIANLRKGLTPEGKRPAGIAYTTRDED